MTNLNRKDMLLTDLHIREVAALAEEHRLAAELAASPARPHRWRRAWVNLLAWARHSLALLFIELALEPSDRLQELDRAHANPF
jgi:hypothetical protein